MNAKKEKIIVKYGIPLMFLAGSITGWNSDNPKAENNYFVNEEYNFDENHKEKLAHNLFSDSLDKFNSKSLNSNLIDEPTSDSETIYYANDLEKKVYGTGEYVGKTLLERFREYDDLFLKYSLNPPKNFTQEQFMALLVAIAEQESSLGYPNGEKRNNSLLMGYDNGGEDREKYRGLETQMRVCSNTLRKAFNGENSKYNLEDYQICMRNILSIYYRGKVNNEGLQYAESVVDKYKKWKREFSKE